MPENKTADERLAVVEVEVKGLEAGLDRLHERHVKLGSTVGEIHTQVYGIKEDIAKANGALPHMTEKLDQVIATQTLQTASMQVDRDARNNERVAAAEQKIRVRIIWAILAAIGMAMLGITGKLSYDYLKDKVTIQPVIEMVIENE